MLQQCDVGLHWVTTNTVHLYLFLAGKTPFTNIKSAAVTVKKPLAGAQSTLALSASTGNNKMCMHKSVFGSTIYNY